MANSNVTLKWIHDLGKDKIVFDAGILDGTKNRGIYGIFVIDKAEKSEYCAYIGRAVNIYSRFFSGENAHFVKLRKEKLKNDKIVKALSDENKRIEVRVIEPIEFDYIDYCKDTQRMASRECFYIDYYQSLGQCREQYPDGSNIKRSVWDEERKSKDSE